jgi:hypothetical protein
MDPQSNGVTTRTAWLEGRSDKGTSLSIAVRSSAIGARPVGGPWLQLKERRFIGDARRPTG